MKPVRCFGNVSREFYETFQSYCEILPLNELCRHSTDIYIGELAGNNSVDAELASAREAGLITILWVNGGVQLFPQLLQQQVLCDYIVLSDWGLLELCLRTPFLNSGKLIFNPVVHYKQANPYHVDMGNGVFPQLGITSNLEKLRRAVSCIYEIDTNLGFRVFDPDEMGFDSDVLATVARNQNLLLMNSGHLSQCFGTLAGVAADVRSAIAWIYMIQDAPEFAQYQRYGAMRVLLENFSPLSVMRRVLDRAGIVHELHPVVTLAAKCYTQEQIEDIYRNFERQNWGQKKLILFSDLPVSERFDIKHYPLSALNSCTESLNLDSTYFGILSKDHFYGENYIRDLVLAAEYGGFAGVANAVDSVLHTEEYKLDVAVDLVRGIVRSNHIVGVPIDDLFDSKEILYGAQIPSGEFFVDATCERYRHFCESGERGPVITVQEIEQKAIQDSKNNIAESQSRHCIHLDAQMLVQVDTGTVELEQDTLKITADTQGKPIYAKPAGYTGKFSDVPNVSSCGGVVPGKRYHFSANINADECLDATLMLVVYDKNKQLVQFKLTSKKESSHIVIPDTAEHYLLLLRLVGCGAVTCSNICLEELPDLCVNLLDFKGAEVVGDALYCRCAFNEGAHIYLRPEGFDARRLAMAPAKDYFPALVPGSQYTLSCKGWSSSPELCEIMLLFYDNEVQIGRASVGIGKQVTVRVPENTMFTVPAIRLCGSGDVFLFDISGYRIIEQGEKMETAPYYAVLTNHYPSQKQIYANMFVHTRVKAYRDQAINVRVFVIKRQREGLLEKYVHEGVEVWQGRASEIEALLKSSPPVKALIHFVNKTYMDILDHACPGVQKLIWCHGADVYPAYNRTFNMRNYRQLSQHCSVQVGQTAVIDQLLGREDVTIIPVSNTLKCDMEADYGTTISGPVIHNYIDTDCFSYVPKPKEARLRVASVKSNAMHVYANDLNAQVILELSKRSCFERLVFDIYGQGTLFYSSYAEVARFQNVHLHQTFLSPETLADVYHDHGILLIPTRHDTQGVSRDEAMACGMVPVTSAVGAVPEFVDDTCGFLLPPEDVTGMADAIEQLVENPELFQQMSENAAKQVRMLSSFNETLAKEIQLIWQ